MERELMEVNLRLLSEEISGAGFPEAVLVDLRRQMGQRFAGDMLLFFETEMVGCPVKGSLYLERESADGPFRFAHFDVGLGKDSGAPVRENSFVRGSGYAVSLREAVNLMEGRSVYREPAFDAARQGYWVSLSKTGPIAGMHLLDYMRSDFRVEVAIRESPLPRWLDLGAQEKLAAGLRQGDRVQLELKTAGQRRMVFVEADPGVQRLRVTDSSRKIVELPEFSRSVVNEAAVIRSHSRRR